MSGQKKKRNHWVSQAYLRPFSKNEGQPRLRPIRNVAVGFYLYAPRPAGARLQL